MRYYKLLFDDEQSKNNIVCFAEEDFENKYTIGKYDLSKGNLIKNWNENFTFYFDPKQGDKPADYLINNLGWMIISSKFKSIIENLEVNGLQFLPIKLKNSINSNTIEGYNVVNIKKLTDALNLEHSVYSIFELEDEKILSIKKYALSIKNLKDTNIFRLKGQSEPIFVSEKLMQSIIDNNLTGCDFLEVKVII